jgi:5-bromo-4-chloroindolyl phosphate hydrolysis protein
MKTNETLIQSYLNQDDKTHGQVNSLFYEYDRIYSYGYHYILGHFIDKQNLIINDIGYSMTTSKHINLLMWEAQKKGIKIHRITQIELNYVYNQLKYFEQKLIKARKPLIWINQIKTLYDTFREFNKVHGILIITKSQFLGQNLNFSKVAEHSQKIKDIANILSRAIIQEHNLIEI